MNYYNKTERKHYIGGMLKTADRLIFNPTHETLLRYGYEPFRVPDKKAATKEEVVVNRYEAYIRRVDPITAEISRLRDMGGTPQEIEEAMNRRAEMVNQIKSEFPYPEEEA